jgi:hypothetical protein
MAVVGIEAEIEDALLYRLSQLVFSPAIPVAYPGVAYDPTGVDTYIEAHFFTAPTDRLAVNTNAPHDHTGLLQLSLRTKPGQGDISPRILASQILAHFAEDAPIDRNTVRVKVLGRGTAAAGRLDGAWWHIPITIKWQCFA